MSRTTAPLLAGLGLAFAASGRPLVAQKSVTITRTAPRIAASDSLGTSMRRLERSLDSLVRSFEYDELTPDQRFSLRRQIDQAVFQLAKLRASLPEARGKEGNVFIRRMPAAGFEARVGDFGAAAFPRLAQTAMAPGWIGIVVTGAPTEIRVENDEMFMRYLAYPEIASVDPSSPAQRAGLFPGDTLLAYNGHDVRRDEISMTRLLRPKATVKVRVRRDGRDRELPVVVAETPARIRERRAAEMRDASAPWMAIEPTPLVPRTPMTMPPPRAPMMPASPLPSTRSVGAIYPVQPVPFDAVMNGLAGAQMSTVTEAMKRNYGLPTGVLVTSVAIGSPAAESGLEDSDVIVRVNDQAIARLGELREQIARAADERERSVTLDVRRGKERRTITLRW